MADSFLLFGHGFVILLIGAIKPCIAIRAAVAFFTAGFQEKFGLIPVFFITGNHIQLKKGQLDFLMARGTFPFTGTKDITYQIGVFQCNIEEFAASRSQIMGNGGFIHMAGIIQLMHVFHVGPASFGPSFGNGIIGVQITVIPLGLPDSINDLLNFFSQSGILILFQGITRPFYKLVHIGIPGAAPAISTGEPFRVVGKLADVFPFFALPEAIRKRYIPVGLHSGFPEVVLYFHMGVIYRLNGVRIPFLPDDPGICRRPAGRIIRKMYLHSGNQKQTRDHQ